MKLSSLLYRRENLQYIVGFAIGAIALSNQSFWFLIWEVFLVCLIEALIKIALKVSDSDIVKYELIDKSILAKLSKSN